MNRFKRTVHNVSEFGNHSLPVLSLVLQAPQRCVAALQVEAGEQPSGTESPAGSGRQLGAGVLPQGKARGGALWVDKLGGRIRGAFRSCPQETEQRGGRETGALSSLRSAEVPQPAPGRRRPPRGGTWPRLKSAPALASTSRGKKQRRRGKSRR